MNVILVYSDKNRRDNFSCYGPTRVRTPRLDRFARESCVFENAYLGSFPTVPNRLDMMSGRFSFAEYEWCPLPDQTVTLQQILTASGFTTQMIVDNPHLLEDGFNYSRGFLGFEWIRGQEGDHWKTAPRQVKLPGNPKKNRSFYTAFTAYMRNTSWWRCEEDHFAPRTILAACDWLSQNASEGPFFLYLDLFDPHEPWDAPEHYLRLYEEPGYHGEEAIFPHYDFWRDFLTFDELNHIRNLYRAEVSMVDHWFGVLLDKVAELGLEEDTAVIFVSDHGHLFGEHGIAGMSLIEQTEEGDWYEAVPMYSELRRIPLMIRLPGQKAGRRIKGLVQTPDLMPTILELAGVVTSEGLSGREAIQALQCGVFTTRHWRFEPASLHGRSLVPLLTGQAERVRDIAVCSNTIIRHSPIIAKCAVVIEDGWALHYAGSYDRPACGGTMYVNKIIDPAGARISTAPELYHLAEDPGEMHDCIDENVPLAREIHARYVAFLEEIGTPAKHLAGRRDLGLVE